LMRAAGWCEEGASDRDALATFEDYTQNVVVKKYGATKGSGLFSYWEFLVMWFVTRTPFDFDRFLAPQPDYGFEEWRFRVGKILFHLCEGLGIFPFVFIFLATWASSYPHLRGWAELVWLGKGMAICLVLLYQSRGLDPVAPEEHTDLALFKLFGITVFSAICANLMFFASRFIEWGRPDRYRHMAKQLKAE